MDCASQSGTVILKIGGGILRDKDSFERVVSIVEGKKKSGKKQIIVISALYGVTDSLLDSMKKCFHNSAKVEETIASLKKMHKDYLKYLSNPKIRQSAEFALDEEISVLEKFLYGISYLKEISPRSKDLIQSFGERLSPIVLEAFLLDKGINAEFMDAEEVGIFCKGPFENAIVELEKTKKSLEKKAMPQLKDKVILLPGYYGVDEAGDVKTFGRGGTDYSAGFIANIFNAELEVWKDVSGFMTADPKVVPAARQIETLSYDEAAELGYLGAKILHPKTIDPLRQKGLCAEIKNVFAPEVRGTIICGEKKMHECVVKSIATTKDIVLITVNSMSMINMPGFASTLFLKLAERDISIDLIVTSETSITFSVDNKSVEGAMDAAKSLSDSFPCTVSSKKDVSMLGIIGEGIQETSGIAGRLFSALGKEKINVELIAQGSSAINLSFVVKKADLDRALQTTHKEFIE